MSICVSITLVGSFVVANDRAFADKINQPITSNNPAWNRCTLFVGAILVQFGSVSSIESVYRAIQREGVAVMDNNLSSGGGRKCQEKGASGSDPHSEAFPNLAPTMT